MVEQISMDDAAQRGFRSWARSPNGYGPFDMLEWASFAISGPGGWFHGRTMNWCDVAKDCHVIFIKED